MLGRRRQRKRLDRLEGLEKQTISSLIFIRPRDEPDAYSHGLV
jgi:hypothetical protein